MENTLTRSCAAKLIVPPVTSQSRLLHSMMTGETSQRIEIYTLARTHHAPIHARTPYTRVTVYDEVLPLVLCQKLAVEIKGVAGADPDAHKLSIMHPVPSSVYQTILSILGGDEQVVPLQVPMEARLVPARVSSQGVPLHQVRSSCWLAGLHPLTINHDMLLLQLQLLWSLDATAPLSSLSPPLARCCRTTGILLDSRLHSREKTVMAASAAR